MSLFTSRERSNVSASIGHFGSDQCWTIFGVIGVLVFQGRFYVQWITSELKKRSVMPIMFWYMSSVGTIMLLVYSIHLREPVGALGQGLNIIIYSRNLVHIWRNKGVLSRRADVAVHAVVALIAAISVYFVGSVWWSTYELSKPASSPEATSLWIWLAVGVLGNALFACRFLVQWYATERARKPVIPNSFWYISVVASAFLLMSYLDRGAWVFVLGTCAGLLIYFRNLWLIYSTSDASTRSTEAM